MTKKIFLISILILILLSSCIFFQTINQPYMSRPNEIVTVSITATTEGGGNEPYFGVCLPTGWTIPGDSLQCSGVYNEVIYYDSLISFEQEIESPAPQGYYWWAGKGTEVSTDSGNVYTEFQIQTDSQFGHFSIDYMLGNSREGVNRERSDNHQIDIVDEYTRGGLRCSVIGDSVMLNWIQPFNTNGLLGYNIYRDEQQINSILVVDSTYIDENSLEGMHYYSISSVYDNGNEYLISYEQLVIINLYVSPTGNNSNNGSSFSDALLTINYAVSVITPDSLLPQTIYLSQGIFSPSANGDVFPIEWKNYISLEGISEEETILDGDSLSRVVRLWRITKAKFENLTIRNGYDPAEVQHPGRGGQGGGIFCRFSNLELVNVTITNNSADNSGGGIWFESDNYPRLLELENVTITNNSAEYGGGILIASCDARLTNVTIANNSATSTSISGGGGILLSGCDASLTNVTIANNSTNSKGGAILCKGSNPELVNVTITNNSAVENGGGIRCEDGSNPILNNCILWNDSPEEIYFYHYGGYNTITISYSDIQGGEAGIVTNNNGTVNWEDGNTDEDPLFIGTGDYPYTLSSGSPCIDAGNPDTTYNDPEDPNNPGYALWPAMGTLRNDMGAYGGPNAVSWIIVGIEDDENEELQTPTEFELSQNYPNPFNPTTTIQYAIKERASVELILYDILGSQVVVLVNEEQDAGYYKIDFNAGRLASGIYFYRIQAGSFIETKKMILLK